MEIEVYLSLGTDIGDRKANLSKALDELDKAFKTHFDTVSKFYETEPWGFESGTMFLNAAVKYVLIVPRGTNPDDFGEEILRKCKNIEAAMGRKGVPEYDGAGKRIYRSRIIDIDILLIGSARIGHRDLTVPHPLMTVRDFVMVPLMEIASESIKSEFPEIFSNTKS